ncbi:unnamed protein product, partial [Soboliphyme baturini]|uniref:Secreted protein n=1 Tax=Soboliphyme baturini TaxID=241478 RepID=A0A183IYP2_9BILA
RTCVSWSLGKTKRQLTDSTWRTADQNVTKVVTAFRGGIRCLLVILRMSLTTNRPSKHVMDSGQCRLITVNNQNTVDRCDRIRTRRDPQGGNFYTLFERGDFRPTPARRRRVNEM